MEDVKEIKKDYDLYCLQKEIERLKKETKRLETIINMLETYIENTER